MSLIAGTEFNDEHSAFLAANQIIDDGALQVVSRREEMITEPPPWPHTTADLIAEVAEQWNWTGKQTMMIAQALFEGGLITYPRTDSTRLSPTALVDIRAAVIDNFGMEAISVVRETFIQGSEKGANIEDAHEAIRPTDPAHQSQNLDISPDQCTLYRLIWQRTLASQMKPARYQVITVMLENVDYHAP
jgi:DNA topoisomerase I